MNESKGYESQKSDSKRLNSLKSYEQQEKGRLLVDKEKTEES